MAGFAVRESSSKPFSDWSTQPPAIHHSCHLPYHAAIACLVRKKGPLGGKQRRGSSDHTGYTVPAAAGALTPETGTSAHKADDPMVLYNLERGQCTESSLGPQGLSNAA